MTPSRSPAALSLTAALTFVIASGCDYGSVDPSSFDVADASTGGGGGGDDGSGDDGSGDPGRADGGPGFVHLSFPIAQGDIHGAFGCADCHGDLDSPGDPALLVCTGCHTGSHDEGAMESRHAAGHGVGSLFEWSPPACVTCHPQAAVYTRAQHEEVVDEDGHDGASCSACHPQRSDLTPSTFEATRCTPCHSGDPEDDD